MTTFDDSLLAFFSKIVSNVIFTAIGAAVLWSKWGRKQLEPYLLPHLVSAFVSNEKTRVVVEFLMFIALGCVVGIGVCTPDNPRQALAAGFGWTGFFTTRK